MSVDIRKYMLPHTSYEVEDIEWSNRMEYGSRDTVLPRALTVGDSICCGYQGDVRRELEGICHLSFWASSLCVTAPTYLRELETVMERFSYRVVTFNNGLHSLDRRDLGEWGEAYRLVVEYMQAKAPAARLLLVLSTPTKDPALTERSRALNDVVLRIAADKDLPVVDLFSAMDPLDRETYWSDCCHFRQEAVKKQAEIIAAAIKEQLALGPAGQA